MQSNFEIWSRRRKDHCASPVYPPPSSSSLSFLSLYLITTKSGELQKKKPWQVQFLLQQTRWRRRRKTEAQTQSLLEQRLKLCKQYQTLVKALYRRLWYPTKPTECRNIHGIGSQAAKKMAHKKSTSTWPGFVLLII